jgi:predicted glycoside hydrolase/deacetylase ChbG (UPF0249 family)
MATAGIVLCADDYGIAPGVSRAIRDLLERRRLSATGCMVVSPDFVNEGPLLASYLDHADIGLHFTLTFDRPLGAVMRAAYFRQLDVPAAAAELNRQIESFTRIVGRPPAFIDGHQHVHQLPGVRDSVVESARRIGAYVRVTDERIGAILRAGVCADKAGFLAIMAAPTARRVRRSGAKRNTGFRGVRSFHETGPYGDLFRRMIARARAGTIVMCHPGLVDDTLKSRDPVTAAREGEYRYFLSDEFPADLAAAHLRLARLQDAFS